MFLEIFIIVLIVSFLIYTRKSIRRLLKSLEMMSMAYYLSSSRLVVSINESEAEINKVSDLELEIDNLKRKIDALEKDEKA